MVDFGAIIGDSANWTAKMLFKPFNFKKWMVLTFIALMAGAMSGGGNFNTGNWGNSGRSHHYESAQQQQQAQPAPKMTPAEKQIMFAVIGCMALFFIAFLILFIWLGSRFSFVFLEDVIKNGASIRGPFGANREIGNSYFRFNLVLTSIFLIFFGFIVYLFIMAAIKVDLFNTPKPTDAQMGVFFLSMIPALIGWLILFAIWAFIAVITVDLAVPIMYKERIRALAAWGRAWALIKKNVGNFIVYVLIKIGLSIGAGIAYLILFIIAFIIVLIPFALLVVALYFLSKAFPASAAVPYWLIVGVALTPVFLFLLYCLTALYLPISVFFRAYSVKFLGKLDPQYELIPTERPLAPQQ